MRVAIIGGTGDLGKGLASRLSRNHQVVIGSRDASKAGRVAAELRALTGHQITGLSNLEAAAGCDVAILAIPALLDSRILIDLKRSLDGKLVISPIVPLVFENGVFSHALREGSAAEMVASVLGPRVVAALHTVPAERLAVLDEELDYDVLVASESKDDFEEAAGVISSIKKLRPLHCGGLRNARLIESLTPLLLNVGRRNKLKSPSLKIV